MSFTSTQLEAILRLVSARVASTEKAEREPWAELQQSVETELRHAQPGELVFRLDIPLVLEIPRKRPKKKGATLPASLLRRARGGKPIPVQEYRLAISAAPADKPIIVHMCPTLNEYNGMMGWQKARAREHVDKLIKDARALWSKWFCGGKFAEKVVSRKNKKTGVAEKKIQKTREGSVRRLVRVTRFSSRKVDDLSADVLGGKIPIDRLVLAEIIGGDSAVWIDRQARWERAATEAGHVLIEVFNLPASSQR